MYKYIINEETINLNSFTNLKKNKKRLYIHIKNFSAFLTVK